MSTSCVTSLHHVIFIYSHIFTFTALIVRYNLFMVLSLQCFYDFVFCVCVHTCIPLFSYW